jgi:hypothetical protein
MTTNRTVLSYWIASTFALIFFGTFLVSAQEQGDIVEVDFGTQEHVKAKIDKCNKDGCYLYLYDIASSDKWSEGTAFFRTEKIRGIKKKE